ncbi:MAG: Fe-S cluster assembly protein SufD [Microthrixaceae bacterium]
MSTDTVQRATVQSGTVQPSDVEVRGRSELGRVIESAGDHSDGVWATEWLEANGLPNPRSELWLYTPLDAITEVLGASQPASGPAPDPATLESAAGRHGMVRIVFVDGRYSPELSDPTDAATTGGPESGPLPPGVVVASADPHGVGAPVAGPEAGGHPPLGHDDGLVVLNIATSSQMAVVRVPAGVAVGTAIHVVHLRTSVPDGASPTYSSPVTTIELAPGASAQVVESHLSLGPGITDAVTRIALAADAHLSHVKLQDEHHDAVHVGHTEVGLLGGARIESTSLSIGASVARNAIVVGLDEPGASAKLSGLSVLDRNQRHDTVLSIDHNAPDCSSDQDFRSVIDDRARSSFCGHVSVAHGAAGTDASQSNRNLLLSRTAEADTRPWLEILADDVKCNHGATVGRLDDDALFYLRSRGVPAARASSMLVAAFASELTDRLEPESLRHALDGAIARLDPADGRDATEGA